MSGDCAPGLYRPPRCSCCGEDAWDCLHVYREPPEGETPFEVSSGKEYHREIWCCRKCGHFASTHDFDLSRLYAGDYARATYGGPDGIRRAFDRIAGLDPSRSDNAGRVERVTEWAARHLASAEPLRVLDVGSGLGVFPARLQQVRDWRIVALEPNPQLAEHIRVRLGIPVIVAEYGTRDLAGQFDLITSNKVLEHLPRPLEMLERHRGDLARRGAVYLELPDGEEAAREGFHREEFFIEHHHVFSLESLERLCQRAGFAVLERERLREPSGKYTLRALLGARDRLG